MNAQFDLEMVVARSVAIVVSYHHFARTWKDWAAIVAKIQAFSEEAESQDIPVDSILPLLLTELSDRFGPETARRLTREFSEMLANTTATDPAMEGHHREPILRIGPDFVG